jgi:hypothetical protein
MPMPKYLALFALAACSALGQQGSGSISGLVTDAQGAVIQGAKVFIRNVGRNSTFNTVSNDRGFYSAPSLPVGGYEVSTEMPGFKKALRKGIVLEVGQKADIDIQLEVGAIADTVEVTAQAQMVDTNSPTVGKVVESRRIEELPLNGRNALALVLLTPSVKSNAGPTSSGFSDRGTQISSISINGGPNSMNSQVLDGNSNILSYVGEVAIPPAVDAVEEFRVQSGSMSAEFGNTAGGVINLVTKSGTNLFHGTLYEFLRNDKFDARNTFAATKNPLRYNQYGGSVGGPVIKNKTFFFFNFEEYKLRQSSPVIASTPILEQRAGDFSHLFDNKGTLIPIYDPNTTRANPSGSGFIRDAFAGNRIPTNRIDPVALKVLNFYPTPNRTPNDPFTNTANFTRQGQSQTDSTQYHMKFDHRFSGRNSIFGRYSFFEHKPFSTGFFEDPVGNSRRDDVKNRNLVVSDTHTFSPTLINEFRLGFSRQYFPFISASYGGGWPAKLGLPSNVPPDVLPTFAFGYTNLGNGSVGVRGSLNYDLNEMLTKIKGNQTIKFGWNHRLLRGNNNQAGNPSGTFTFSGGLTGDPQRPTGTGSGLATLVLGSVSSASAERVLGQSIQAFETSLFVQDDWKFSRTLTINLGLRWDFQQQPVERHNGMQNFDFNVVDPATGLKGGIVYAGINGTPRTFRKNDFNDFGPRVGFAWDILGKGKTVFRGGYAIFYPQMFFRANFGGSFAGFSNTSTAFNPPGGNSAFPSFQLQGGLPGPLIQPQGAKLGPSAFLGQGVSLTESYGNTPMSMQWNFSLQHQLPGRWLVEAAYSANRGEHFIANSYDFNQLDPQYLALGLALNSTVPNPNAGKVPGSLGAATITRNQSLRPFPYYTSVNINNPHNGNFNSQLMLLSVEKRMAKGLTVMFSFTGGKVISDSLGVPVDFGPVEQVTENGYQNGKYDRRVSKSIDPSDISKRAVISLLYEIPFAKKKIYGGWQVNTIGIMQTGLPLIVRGASNFAANRPNSTGTSAKLDNPTRYQWFDTSQFVNPPDWTFGNVGRVLPDVRGPGTINWDLSIIKNTKITERISLQFRAESFNFMNHVNYGQPGVSFTAGPNGKNSNGSFGLINSARDARVGQLGLKLIF